MINNEYNMDIYESVKISIVTVIRNPEIIIFAPDHLKNVSKVTICNKICS